DISGERSDLRSYPRTFAQCDVVGGRIASAALKANLEGGTQFIGAVSDSITLPLESSSPERSQQDSCQAVDLKSSGDSSRLVPPESEVRPAESSATDSRIEWKARITVFHWGPAVIVTLPGEPFSKASMEIRRRVSSLVRAKSVLVLGYSDGCPG